MEMVVFLILAFLNVATIIFIFIFRTKKNNDSEILQTKIQHVQSIIEKMEEVLRDEFRTNREENMNNNKDNRLELNNSLKDFKSDLTNTHKVFAENTLTSLNTMNGIFEQKIESLITKVDENNRSNREELSKNIKEFFNQQKTSIHDLEKSQTDSLEKIVVSLEKISGKVEEKLLAILVQAKADSKSFRDELTTSFTGFQTAFDKNVNSFNTLQREKFGQLEQKQNEMISNTETKLNLIKSTVEEKLEKTLSERLGQSFESVSKHLIEVQKGLGEMQILAQDVGGLKKVLSNVKMRGNIGEIQLSMLLEQILSPDQYASDVKTKAGSKDVVEFAVKLPGKGENNSSIWLPIDAKFPKDVYEQLLSAHDVGDLNAIEQAQKNLEATIKKMAKDIGDKYIDPPSTTDFGIMFLPFEGIFAEVVRKASLLEDLHRNYRVIVTGPTTLAAILNSLQMGFKTLAIEKRSSEVWEVLGAVKKEFESFGGLMQKAQTNIRTGLNQLDDVMGVRTRAIQRKLKDVESLSAARANAILPEISTEMASVSDEEN